MRLSAGLLVLICSAAFICRGAEPAVDARELPRVLPLEPAEALKSFEVKKGFRLELVAAEPLVVDPVALAFDENGRLFVVEMRDYSERRDEHLGRIRVLTDSDDDGHFDKSTVYAEGLGWPTAVFPYDGGVFVGCTPYILYFKDTNNDGVADQQKVLFTGFGEGQERLNVQGMLNSFNWTLDNRIHAAAGLNGGKIQPVLSDTDGPGVKPVDVLELRGKDFSFDPRNLRDIRPESGGGQHGLTFDDAGRKFVCHNSRHIMQVMYEDHYAGRNPLYSMPPPLVDIPVDGPSAEVFRISPEEPWRVIRTKWRVAGQVSGPVEGGGRASGYFTSATGITIYRGDAFPDEYKGDAFIADVGSNLIHRKKLDHSKIPTVAKRPDDELKSEFIACKDLWFRPVQFANAPDGTLYIADMYREVVEHPWSIPESIKKHLDLNSGNDRGRIYRIVPDGFKQPKPVRLGKASTSELVALLAHPNGWHRDTAARLLYERQDKAAVPQLANLLKESKSPLGRMHAIFALKGLGALSREHLNLVLSDSSDTVRLHGIRLSEPRWWGKIPSSPFQVKRDDSKALLYQLAFSLGELRPLSLPTLADVVKLTPSDDWIQSAALSSAGENAFDLFLAIVKANPAGAPVRTLRELAQMVGAKNNPKELTRMQEYLATPQDTELGFQVAAGFGEGLRRAGLTPSAIEERLSSSLKQAEKIAADASAPENLRTNAVVMLGLATFNRAGASLVKLLGPEQPPSVQFAALAALDRFSGPYVADGLITRWSMFSPGLRSQAMNVLLRRTERISALLGAIEKGVIQSAELSATQAKPLRNHRDPKIRELANKVLQPAPARRGDVVQRFLSSLDLKGDVERGKVLYLERCASCHRYAGQGNQLGPDLETVKTTGKEKLLINILDPNREVPPNYLAYLVETTGGDIYLGLIAHETPSSLTIRQAFGKEDVLPRSQVQKIQSQGQSLMPDGLEADLSPRDIASLIEYLIQ